jgi:hypothetical protein
MEEVKRNLMYACDSCGNHELVYQKRYSWKTGIGLCNNCYEDEKVRKQFIESFSKQLKDFKELSDGRS